MNTNKLLLLLLPSLLLFIIGCAVEPKPIAYGSDSCHFCRMTVVDKQHGSEIVTNKGKVYKFDAVECMLNYMRGKEEQSMALFLVNGYTNPGELLDATSSFYLISEGIPSPMGAYLTAFENERVAIKAQKEHGGTVYNWQQIRDKFNK